MGWGEMGRGGRGICSRRKNDVGRVQRVTRTMIEQSSTRRQRNMIAETA